MFVICIPPSHLLSSSLIHFDEWGVLCVPCSFCFSSSLQMFPSFYVTILFSIQKSLCPASLPHSDWAVPVKGSQRHKKMKLEQRQRNYSQRMMPIMKQTEFLAQKTDQWCCGWLFASPWERSYNFQWLARRLHRWWKD